MIFDELDRNTGNITSSEMTNTFYLKLTMEHCTCGKELRHKTALSDVPQCSSFSDGRRLAVIKLRNLTPGERRTVISWKPQGSSAVRLSRIVVVGLSD